ncbi:hypothetical protein [Streptomyces gobiensis]|uniref:hypothetical protein n=1 Tax=Streptomyces gobiensis TaxID=2875706 RepID=UPI001E344BB1|nr:hypothetical protein [Streptomyces gobiensis]UGY94705.1 hypothetical protein test1122_25205 [Streptomyces gobiensis]
MRRPGLAVGGEEQAGRVPAFAPLLLGELGVCQVVPGLRQATAADHNAWPTVLDALLDAGEPGFEGLHTALLLEPRPGPCIRGPCPSSCRTAPPGGA